MTNNRARASRRSRSHKNSKTTTAKHMNINNEEFTHVRVSYETIRHIMDIRTTNMIVEITTKHMNVNREYA